MARSLRLALRRRVPDISGRPGTLPVPWGFASSHAGDHVHVWEPGDTADNPVLRYLAIMSAARDFGLSRAELGRVATRFHPLDVSPRTLADALADALNASRRST